LELGACEQIRFAGRLVGWKALELGACEQIRFAGWLESAQVIIAVMGARGLMGVLGLTLVVLVLATSSLSTPAEATGALMFKKSTKKKAASTSTSTKFKVGFYTGSCATVETRIKNAVVAQAKLDPTIIPALIRLFFHDCFANGKCDASVLLKGTSTTKTELDSTTNLTLRGLDFIDFLKSMLTKANCTQVSCADIVALSARDAVVAGGGTFYSIPTGRMDGKVSLKADADNMPTSRTPITGILAQFSNKGFSAQEMVVLTGIPQCHRTAFTCSPHFGCMHSNILLGRC